MKISEMIAELEEFKFIHGDIDVCYKSDWGMGPGYFPPVLEVKDVPVALCAVQETLVITA